MMNSMRWFLVLVGILILSVPLMALLARVVAWASAQKRHGVFSHLRQVGRRDRSRC